MMSVLELALILITVGLLILTVIFITYLIGIKGKTRYDVGGGIRSTMDVSMWKQRRNEKEQKILKDWDIKLLNKLSKSGEYTIDEIVAYLQESSPSIRERLNRLEAKGYITKTSAGSVIITEKGRKYVESLREKLWYRKKEKELLERKTI